MAKDVCLVEKAINGYTKEIFYFHKVIYNLIT